MQKKYQVLRTNKGAELNGDWTGDVWGGVEFVEIKDYMGDEPAHQPKTQAKVLYDDKNIYVIFRVEDKYVRAVTRKHQGAVCSDSCVEFFFAPHPDSAKGYFNLEVNCGGTMLLYHVIEIGVEHTVVDTEDCKKIEIYHSEPKIVEPEKQGLNTWVVEYRVPLDMLEKYSSVVRPAPGVTWRANFYKCADATSKPHWLTWSPVDYPTPNFHLPEFFGVLEFK